MCLIILIEKSNIMDVQYFQPLPGKKYLNHNGFTYFCLQKADVDCSALFISISSGYTLIAHGCSKNEDGSIDWISSVGKGFNDVNSFVEQYGFDNRLL